MRRIRLSFTPDIEVYFVDREQALKRVEKWAEKGTRFVQMVYGPEGCGKTAWLRQSVEILRGMGFDVIYINPLEKGFLAEVGVEEVRMRLLEILREATDEAWARAVWAAVDLARELIKAGRKKLAILADDVFQAIGLSRASIYVKGLLGLIEYPPRSYERIVAVVATSEGLSRFEIGRHRWAELRPMWNMSREGFRELYDMIPGEKPAFEDIWRISGGNPAMLARLYRNGWSFERVVDDLVREKKLDIFIASLDSDRRRLLAEAVNDPDVLLRRGREGVELLTKLVELNLVVDELHPRDPWFWIDVPPPERDYELGIGEINAWQTPLHREAVKITLEKFTI
ncbi:MAG: ATP-binding protein [Sulfolobales archaeon]